jgi:hypothetical protein
MAEIQEFDDIESMGELETVEEQLQQEVETPKASEPNIPRQFQGKSIEEIANYAAATERSLSRQGQELGDVRKLADELLKAQLVSKKEHTQEAKVDFFVDPDEAVRQAIENNPRMQAVERHSREVQIAQAKTTLLQKHPDVSTIMQDPEFANWVNGSRVRTSLFQSAENYDLDAADELLSTFKELKGVRQKNIQSVDNTARDSALKSASVDTGGSGESSKKVYRSADLIRLKIRDPAKYEAMSDEIYRAYDEGRVR